MKDNKITLNSNLSIQGNLLIHDPLTIYRPPEDLVDIRINDSQTIRIGEINNKHKIYIVEPWQSKKPIHVKNGLWVSLEKDLISYDEIKIDIIRVLDDIHPDISLKVGMNPDNITLVKNEVTLEINKRN